MYMAAQYNWTYFQTRIPWGLLGLKTWESLTRKCNWFPVWACRHSRSWSSYHGSHANFGKVGPEESCRGSFFGKNNTGTTLLKVLFSWVLRQNISERPNKSLVQNPQFRISFMIMASTGWPTRLWKLTPPKNFTSLIRRSAEIFCRKRRFD